MLGRIFCCHKIKRPHSNEQGLFWQRTIILIEIVQGVQLHLETIFLPEILRQNESYLFQHSKCNAPVQFPQSSLIAVVSKYRLGFRISQPFIFCMFMRQLQKSVRYSHCKCVLRNDETFFTPYCFCVLKTVGGYAAAGVELEKVTCIRNPGFFKGFSFCRLND